MKILKDPIQKFIGLFGYSLIRGQRFACHPEASASEITIMETVKPYTMTSPERIWSLVQAVKYIIANDIPGDFVECGVWRGGSTMVMALKCLDMGVSNKFLWLYDTFTGMSEPTDCDYEIHSNRSASDALSETKKDQGADIWCVAPQEDVLRNLEETNYPMTNFKLVRGKVEETLKLECPTEIALLRLDTDWYESTKAELNTLFPRLSKGGVCIIDDYGHWAGSKKAVDEYLMENDIVPLFNRVDNTGRIFTKS